jgi:hypothetical protein
MNRTHHSYLNAIFLATLCVLALTGTAFGQSSAFSYQGRLSDNNQTANGVYDFQFKLWDSLSGGMQQPHPVPFTLTRSNVVVSGGVFSVSLDFGATAFPGAARYLEIAVRAHSNDPNMPAYTPLTPRQAVSATPYALTAQTVAGATAATTANSVVKRDAQGNFSAGTISANLNGAATSFSGNLAGDVTGTQINTVVAKLRNTPLASTAPTNGQVLMYDGTNNQWAPASLASQQPAPYQLYTKVNTTNLICTEPPCLLADTLMATCDPGSFRVNVIDIDLLSRPSGIFKYEIVYPTYTDLPPTEDALRTAGYRYDVRINDASSQNLLRVRILCAKGVPLGQ